MVHNAMILLDNKSQYLQKRHDEHIPFSRAMPRYRFSTDVNHPEYECLNENNSLVLNVAVCNGNRKIPKPLCV